MAPSVTPRPRRHHHTLVDQHVHSIERTKYNVQRLEAQVVRPSVQQAQPWPHAVLHATAESREPRPVGDKCLRETICRKTSGIPERRRLRRGLHDASAGETHGPRLRRRRDVLTTPLGRQLAPRLAEEVRRRVRRRLQETAGIRFPSRGRLWLRSARPIRGRRCSQRCCGSWTSSSTTGATFRRGRRATSRSSSSTRAPIGSSTSMQVMRTRYFWRETM